MEAIDLHALSSILDVCGGYEFARPVRGEIDIQMRVCAKIILEGIRDPGLGRDSRIVLDSIPKLRAPPGIEKKAMAFGWGFHAGQGFCVAKIIYWISVVLVLGLGFVPFWLASIDKLDLQNAFAPVSFLAMLITMALAICAIGSSFKQ